MGQFRVQSSSEFRHTTDAEAILPFY